MTGKSQEDAQGFLLEIGVEELPASAARAALLQAKDLVAGIFSERRLQFQPQQINIWVTPRRIAIFLEELGARQAAEEFAERGPRADAAFDEKGKPTKAAAGFARAKGVKVEDLETRQDGGQQFVYAVHRKEGRPAVEILPEICQKIITSMTFPKTMRWDDAGLRFPRPIRWVVAKYGAETSSLAVGGLKSSSKSRGHRPGSGEVDIKKADSYREALRKEKVIVDQEERRSLILEGLEAEAAKRGAGFIDPKGELEEVIYLVESPSVQSGDFEERHLRLPDRVLVTAMQSHQRYFPLVDGSGSLTNGFLYVMNGDDAFAGQITEGNEMVLKGRIEDAEFSFDKDVAAGIDAMAGRLDEVVFHNRLGSLKDKCGRLVELSGYMASLLGLGENENKTLAAAAGLAKADQVSVMVHEFPELEGYMGSVYANIEGYHAAVCDAIAEQYLPSAAAGELPDSVPGAVLSVCDKIDNITGAFAIDEIPSGSRDPYGLRRASAGIVEINEKFEFDYSLIELLGFSLKLYQAQNAGINNVAEVVESAYGFICDRLQNRMVEKGMPVEVLSAARQAGIPSTNRMIALAGALDSFRTDSRFDDLHTAFFRSAKIAAKAGDEADKAAINTELFEEDAERELFQKLDELEPRLKELTGSGDYEAALIEAAALRPEVDRYFDDVLVMAEDERLRINRLALLRRTVDLLVMLGDPMKVAAAPK